MKAIIMAGGLGTRLRPLTNEIPKPMVPIIDRPVMSYIIELLKNHGFTDIAVTLNYKPKIITDYFEDGARLGVRLRYYIETTPLGTAGSVKNAADFLDDDFLIMSGDAFTDMDLSDFARYHFMKKAIFTLACKYCDDAKVCRKTRNKRSRPYQYRHIHGEKTGLRLDSRRLLRFRTGYPAKPRGGGKAVRL